MSIASEVARLQAAKDGITSAIEEKGVPVPAGTRYDGFPALIEGIQGGGGSLEDATLSTLRFADTEIAAGTVDAAQNVLLGGAVDYPLSAQMPITNLYLGDKIRVSDMYAEDSNFVYVALNHDGAGTMRWFREFAMPGTFALGTSPAAYSGSQVDVHLENAYYPSIRNPIISDAIRAVTVTVALSGGSTLTTVSRHVYAPGNVETTGDLTVNDGNPIPYLLGAASNRIKLQQGTATPVQYWLRASKSSPSGWHAMNTVGSVTFVATTTPLPLAPMMTLPDTLMVTITPNADGSYNVVKGSILDFAGSLGAFGDRPTQAYVTLDVVDGTLGTFQLCNNMADAPENRAWENATPNTLHTFANDGKTAGSWAIGVRVYAESPEKTVLCTAPRLLAM